MRLLVNVGGIPTVLFGPGDVRVAHMPDEHVPIAELEAAARTLIVAAFASAGVICEDTLPLHDIARRCSFGVKRASFAWRGMAARRKAEPGRAPLRS